MSLHHTGITVSNLDEAERFFIENFNLERIGGGLYDFDYIRRMVGFPDAVLKISVLAFPGSHGGPRSHRLELIEYVRAAGPPADTATNRPGNAHLCFEVEDIQSEFERLSNRGISFKSPPNEVMWGVNKGAWSVYLNGPDGIALELIQAAK